MLAGATGSEKPRTRLAAPAPSARRATEEAARTTSATKVRGGGLGHPPGLGRRLEQTYAWKLLIRSSCSFMHLLISHP